MAEFRPMIANMLRDGKPHWMRSFSKYKAIIKLMEQNGEIERLAPPNGRAKNMIRLTDIGQQRWVKEQANGAG